MFKISCLGLVLSCFQRFSFIELARVSLLCLMHEGVEGVVKGIHEVGVMDRGLGACKARGVVRYQQTNKQTNKQKQTKKQTNDMMDRGLGACKERGVVNVYWQTNKH